MTTKKKVCVTLPEDVYAALSRLAEESCRTRSGYLRQLIRRHLREAEADPGKKI